MNLPADAGVAPASVHAARLQRRLAFLVVTVPPLGLVVALYLHFWVRPVGWPEIFLFGVMWFLTVIGVELGFHRFFSHGAFDGARGLKIALGILGAMAVEGPIIFWAATHRRHHRYSDKPGDPHSPRLAGPGPWNMLKGAFHAHLGWLFVPEVTDPMRYTPDLMRDRLIFKLDRWYGLWVFLGLLVPALLGGLWDRDPLGFVEGFLWGGLVRLLVAHHTTWGVNSLCHLFGRQTYPARDFSTNLGWASLLTGGGSWHNTHHAFPTLAVNSMGWWQPDPCGRVVVILERLGLAWNVRKPSEKMRARAKDATVELSTEGGEP